MIDPTKPKIKPQQPTDNPYESAVATDNPYEPEHSTGAFGPYDHHDPAGLDQAIEDKTMNSVGGFVGLEGLGQLGGSALGLAKRFPAAAAGFVRGGIPGAAKAVLTAKGLQALLGAGERAAPAMSAPGKAVDYAKILREGFNSAGADASRVSSGNDAMAAGISKLTPQAPNPMSMEEAFNSAGSAGREASMGNAKMAEGITNASVPSKMPLSKAFQTIANKGSIGAGKGLDFTGGMGASMMMGPTPQDQSAQALQGFNPAQPMGAPPQLSSNVTEAKAEGTALVGQPREAIAQQLSLKYDPATVKFVLASLPNRLPQ